MNRTCVRCGTLHNINSMRYSRTLYGWVCNNRALCTMTLNRPCGEDKMKKEDIDDEICQCGHSKGYHIAHNLDPHGGQCEKCNCTIYTWKAFVKYRKL